ncbi:MAG: CmpA/NrtA family ABC transporter substrate-binding protein [Verrucomicrobiota bacterium]
MTRLGFVSLVDAAPLFVASDFGFFSKHGLKVQLTREVGWATIREKLLYGELEAAHAPCPMPFATSLGIQSVPVPCVSGLILSKGGNAIVLSEDLWKRGVRDAGTLKQDINNSRHFRKYIFATVYPCSTHTFLVRDWLLSSGIDPDRDVQIVTLPPSQMCRNLSAGTIDGFCAGEPWPSIAISQEIGWSPATSVDINPGHPEKVLMVKESFESEHHDEHVALITALIEACAFCDEPANRELVSRAMSDRSRVNCPEQVLFECLAPRFNYGMGRVEEKPRFMSFHTPLANKPADAEIDWVLQRLDACGCDTSKTTLEGLKRRVFRPELYEEAYARAELPDVKGPSMTPHGVVGSPPKFQYGRA